VTRRLLVSVLYLVGTADALSEVVEIAGAFVMDTIKRTSSSLIALERFVTLRFRNLESLACNASRLARSIGIPSRTKPRLIVTAFLDVEAATFIAGGFGSRGVVSRSSGTHAAAEEHASGCGVEVEVGVAVGVGVGVGVLAGQTLIATGADALTLVPLPNCPYVLLPQHLALHSPIQAHV
jgi:hypothetical protein